MLTHPERKSRPWLLFFLLILFIVVLWPPFYNFKEPAFIGIPCSYWFQLLWIVVTAILLTQENSPSSWYALFSSRSMV